MLACVPRIRNYFGAVLGAKRTFEVDNRLDNSALVSGGSDARQRTPARRRVFPRCTQNARDRRHLLIG